MEEKDKDEDPLKALKKKNHVLFWKSAKNWTSSKILKNPANVNMFRREGSWKSPKILEKDLFFREKKVLKNIYTLAGPLR